jgi:hypothetical protein
MAYQTNVRREIVCQLPQNERMRLTSSSEIIKRAEQVIRLIIAAYADPNRTFGEFKQHVQDPELADPLRDFTEACRKELNSLCA